MQPSHVYAITAGSAVLLCWIYTCCAWLLSQLKFWLPARPLPYLIERRTYWGPIEYHELAVVLLYTGVNTFAATLQVRSTEDEDVRAAQMAVFNYTLAFVLLASVHISKALGLSDIQRTGIVLVVFLMAILQAVCHIVLRALRQPLDSSSHSFIWGCVAGASMIGILLFYLLRRWLYEMCQLACHALAMLSVYGLWQHCESVLYQRLVECVAAIWLTVGLCLALRVLHRNFSWRLRSSRSRTTLKIFGDTATMILRIPVFRSWVVQPGQYVLLGVPSASRLALVPHPFMVAYWDADHQGRAVSIDLLIAARKGFSRDLLRLHGSSSITSWIDGPYGAACQNFASYNTVMLVASGMGIAALIPYVKEIVHRSCRHQAATSDLCILWEADEHFDGDGDPVQKWLDECIKEDLTRPSKQQILSIRMFARSVKRLKNQQTTWDDNIANIYPEIGRRLDESRGKTLVLVSGNPRLRDRVRGLVRVQGRWQAKFQALPYQPWIEQARPSNSLPAVIELQE